MTTQLLSMQFNFSLSSFNWWVIVDILMLVALATALIVFFKRRNSLKLAVISALYILCYVAVIVANSIVRNGMFDITMRIFQYVTIFAIVVFVVVYQSDFKVLLNRFAHGKSSVKFDPNMTEERLINSANQIVKACQDMAKNDVGALIIIVKNAIPDHLLDSGTALDASVSSGLLESIFSTKGPLHDGAVVIKGDTLLSASCFLPLSQEVNIGKDLGTRHRAAIGITEESDVFAIVVSEETGIISVVEGGKIKRYMTPEKLFEEIKMAYGIMAQTAVEKKRERKFL
ncbi:MAG: DNA integrity scanning protein DisA nucleotide-binding domain protein [Clostridia bacterium]